MMSISDATPRAFEVAEIEPIKKPGRPERWPLSRLDKGKALHISKRNITAQNLRDVVRQANYKHGMRKFVFVEHENFFEIACVR